jgi:hypothetical protein
MADRRRVVPDRVLPSRWLSWGSVGLPEGSGLTESVERSARWRAWCGDREALRRFCGVVQAFANRQLEKELSGAPNMPSVVQAREISEDYGRQRQEQEEQSARQRWRVRARASEVEYNRSRSGTPDEVIDALDERAVDSFSVDLYNIWADETISVEISLSRLGGCRVRVHGSDPQQVHSLFPEIESGAKRGVPKWQWLRSDAMFFPYWLFTALFLAYAIYPWTMDIKDPTTSNRLLLSIASGSLLGGLATAALLTFTHRLFPAFEVTPPAAKGRGRGSCG